MIDRSTILRGPAVIQFNGCTFYSKGDITVDVGLETFQVETAAHGKVDERVIERSIKVKFTPAGEWENLATLYPYGSAVLGASVFGAVDLPLVIQTLSGRKITFSSAAITQMPAISLSSTKTLLGDVEFTCLGKNNEAWTTAGNSFAIAAQAFSDATFDPASILTQPYAAAWGAVAPWDAIKTFAGWEISFDLSLNPVTTDDDGIVDYTFASLAVSASCQPMGITEQQFLDAMRLQGATNARGRSLQAGANDLVFTGTGVAITIKKAQMKEGGMLFNPKDPRIATAKWIATRQFIAGAAQPLFSVATS